MNECFLLNCEKNLSQIRLVVFEKNHVFCVFFEHDKTNLRQFFSRFRRKHSFITACIEKQCTRPIRYVKIASRFFKQIKNAVSKKHLTWILKQLSPVNFYPLPKEKTKQFNISFLLTFRESAEIVRTTVDKFCR